MSEERTFEKVLLDDAFESLKELRTYPLNSHEEECLNIIEEALQYQLTRHGEKS
jgi:hypothetical protein